MSLEEKKVDDDDEVHMTGIIILVETVGHKERGRYPAAQVKTQREVC